MDTKRPIEDWECEMRADQWGDALYPVYGRFPEPGRLAEMIARIMAAQRERCARVAQIREDDGHSCGDFGSCCTAGLAAEIRALK